MSNENSVLPVHIRARSLKKTYRSGPEEVVPFEQLSFEVATSSVVSLLGPSGSGKSTLLSCLAGIETVDSGQLQIGGVELTQLTARGRDKWRAQHVGLVFQSFNLIDVLDARANVLLGLAGRRASRADRMRADDLLERVGLGDRKHHRPSQLSGGQQQRVAIARALIHRPPLILADEPTGNLDPDVSEGILKLFEEINNSGTSVLMATHNHKFIEKFPHRVLKCEKGRVLDSSKEKFELSGWY